jgi:tricorn protease
VRSARFSADRSKVLLLLSGSEIHLFDCSAPKFVGTQKTAVSLRGLRLAIDPETERASMFEDAWRLQRDLFYDPGMHGVDWLAAKHKYGLLLPRVRDRSELNDLLSEPGVSIVYAVHFD